MKTNRLRGSNGLRLFSLMLSSLGLLLLLGQGSSLAASDPWSPKDVIEPAALARQLKSAGNRPLLVHVGFRSLYDQGHIPDSKYCGPAARPDGIQKLRNCLAGIPRNQEIVLYCGCCPWDECPNIRPAFEVLRKMGFKQVRVLDIPNNFGRDWEQKGYPTGK